MKAPFLRGPDAPRGADRAEKLCKIAMRTGHRAVGTSRAAVVDMAPANSANPTTGDTLLAAGALSAASLGRARAFAKEAGCTLSDALIDLKLIDNRTLAHTLSRELGIPCVALGFVVPRADWLRWIPRFAAEQYCLVPVYVRARGVGKTIVYVAMQDPTDQEALRVCARLAGLEVRPMVAPRSEIEEAIQAWYGQNDEETTLTDINVRGFVHDDRPSGVFRRNDGSTESLEGLEVLSLSDMLEQAG